MAKAPGSSPVSLFVATPAYNNQVYASYATCLMKFVLTAHEAGMRVFYAHTVSSSLITKARNILARRFLESDYSHLLFIDADMTFRTEDLMGLVTADKEVIAAICPRKAIDWQAAAQFARRHPHAPADAVEQAGASYGTYETLTGEPFAVDAPVEVAAIGTGIMLIKRAAFERLRAAPGHKTISCGTDAGEEIFFDTEFADGLYISEDISFCRHFRAAGGQVWGAPWFHVGHIGNHEFVGDLAAGARFTP